MTEHLEIPRSGHWFFERHRAAAYHPAAAEEAWARTVDFLRAHLWPATRPGRRRQGAR